jgi:hypothetical protein
MWTSRASTVLAAVLFAAPARAQRFDCGSGDALLDAAYLPADGARARRIHSAVLSFCEVATGRPRRYCTWVVPLVRESGCALEFYAATRAWPARAALGRHAERPEWAWHVSLRRTADGWRVLRLYYDDLERP